jgi:hypothetical protein
MTPSKESCFLAALETLGFRRGSVHTWGFGNAFLLLLGSAATQAPDPPTG